MNTFDVDERRIRAHESESHAFSSSSDRGQKGQMSREHPAPEMSYSLGGDVTPFKPRLTHNPLIRSDEGLTLETSASGHYPHQHSVDAPVCPTHLAWILLSEEASSSPLMAASSRRLSAWLIRVCSSSNVSPVRAISDGPSWYTCTAQSHVGQSRARTLVGSGRSADGSLERVGTAPPGKTFSAFVQWHQ